MNEIVGAVTVSVVDPWTPLIAADMVVLPAATAVATPLTSIVAALVADELHVTLVLKSRTLPSL